VSTRTLLKLALGIGALASIATSPPRWSASAFATLEPSIIDAQRPSSVYVIHGETDGPADGLYGELHLRVDVRDRSTTPRRSSTFRVTLTSSSPDVTPLDLSVSMVDGLGTFETYEHAWFACDASPCVSEWTLTLAGAAPDDALDVSGTAELLADWSKDPQGPTEVRLDVDWIGPLP